MSSLVLLSYFDFIGKRNGFECRVERVQSVSDLVHTQLLISIEFLYVATVVCDRGNTS